MSTPIPMLDLMFFLTETVDNPRHVGSVLIFKRPRGGRDTVREIVAAYRATKPLPPFNRIPVFRKSGLPLWQEQSPFYRSTRLRTPILLTYGEKDFRVPINNGLEFWTVLQRQDVPSRLVVFPDENHWVLKGENSRYFYEEVHGWLAKHLQGEK